MENVLATLNENVQRKLDDSTQQSVATYQNNVDNFLSDLTKYFQSRAIPNSPSDKVKIVISNCNYHNKPLKMHITNNCNNQNVDFISNLNALSSTKGSSYLNTHNTSQQVLKSSKICSLKPFHAASVDSSNYLHINNNDKFSVSSFTEDLILSNKLFRNDKSPLSNFNILTEWEFRFKVLVEYLLAFFSKKTASSRKMHSTLGRYWTFILIVMTIASGLVQTASGKLLEDPHFGRAIVNVTAAVGREAILECVAEELGNYKVAWLRVDTQTILTIHSHVITKNHRIGVTHSEYRTWYLHIKEVKESDRGWYMCQINTDPMKSQVGYLDVVVPPDILDVETSTDLVVQEGANVSLRCAARGSPVPTIMWKRENSETIRIGTRKEVISTMGSVLHISRVSRQQMGPYLCIASNGVPPSVSKRIMLVVHFPPIIWIQYQLIGAYDGQQIVLECNSEAYPKSINYWTGDKGQIIPHNEKFEPILMRDAYRVHMQLIIRDLQSADYGIYKCISKNSLGETDGTINVYRIPKPSTYNVTKLKNGARSRLITEDETYQIADYQTDNPDSQHLDVGNRSNLVKIPGSVLLLSLLSLPSVLIALLAT